MKVRVGKLISSGKTVYEFIGYTYGVVTRDGIAVTEELGYFPFYEISKDDIVWEDEEVEAPGSGSYKFKSDDE